jgi:Tfp pilus assembly protein FimT
MNIDTSRKSSASILIPNRTMSGPHSGFSVAEAVVAIAIIGILVAIAIPTTIRQLQLHRLDSSVSVVSSKIMEARMNAIKRNRTSTLHISLHDRHAIVRTTNASNDVIDIGQPESFYGGVSLDATNSANINFDSMGRLPAGAQTVTLVESNSGRRKNIFISPAGKVTVSNIY